MHRHALLPPAAREPAALGSQASRSAMWIIFENDKCLVRHGHLPIHVPLLVRTLFGGKRKNKMSPGILQNRGVDGRVNRK